MLPCRSALPPGSGYGSMPATASTSLAVGVDPIYDTIADQIRPRIGRESPAVMLEVLPDPSLPKNEDPDAAGMKR